MAFNQCNPLLLDFYDTIFTFLFNSSNDIVSDFKRIQHLRLFQIRSIETQVTLRQPLWQLQSKRIAILSFKDHIFILIIVEQHMLLRNDGKYLLAWFDWTSFYFRQMHIDLFFSVEGQANLFNICNVLLAVQVYSSIERSTSQIWFVAIQLYFDEGAHVCVSY